MIDEVMRLPLHAASLVASSAFMLGMVIAIGGSVKQALAGCHACLDQKWARAAAKPPERPRIGVAISAWTSPR
jgi:hypothetical protein